MMHFWFYFPYSPLIKFVTISNNHFLDFVWKKTIDTKRKKEKKKINRFEAFKREKKHQTNIIMHACIQKLKSRHTENLKIQEKKRPKNENERKGKKTKIIYVPSSNPCLSNKLKRKKNEPTT